MPTPSLPNPYIANFSKGLVFAKSLSSAISTPIVVSCHFSVCLQPSFVFPIELTESISMSRLCRYRLAGHNMFASAFVANPLVPRGTYTAEAPYTYNSIITRHDYVRLSRLCLIDGPHLVFENGLPTM